MFSAIKSGDIANYAHLSGLYAGKDKMKFTLLSYSVAMRKNLASGDGIFTGVVKPEEDIESSFSSETTMPTTNHEDHDHDHDHDHEEGGNDDDDVPSASASASRAPIVKFSTTMTELDSYTKNAAFAEICAKELAFLNRTIQMISLVASRYHEEQEDNHWQDTFGCRGNNAGGFQADDELGESDGSSGSESSDDYEEGGTPSLLARSQSHNHDDVRTSDYNDPRPKNQLANTLLVGSGQLQQHFIGLCVAAGTDIVLVNAMTTTDRPLTYATHERKNRAEILVVSSLYSHFCSYDADHRGEVVDVFQRLRDISQSAWSMMSLLAFSNLFRLTKGTDFEIAPINPDDAIFSNQGRPFRSRMGLPAATFPDDFVQSLKIHPEAGVCGAEGL